MAARIPLPDPIGAAPFSYAAARAEGVTPGRLRGRDLGRPFHGVRHPAGSELDLPQRCQSFQTTMRPDAFFCSVTAAAVMGVPLPRKLEVESTLHVAVPHPIRAPEGRGVTGHKVRLIGDDTRNWNGLPISSPERLWCELAPLLTLPQLVAAGDYLVHHRYPLTTIQRLANASARFPSRAGNSRRREALSHVDSGSESPRESELRVLMAVAGIRGFVPNVTIRVPGATYRGDLVCAQKKVIIEYQSAYHFDPAQQRRDMTRMERLRAAGWYVFQVNSDDMDDPDELAARIRSVLASRPSV